MSLETALGSGLYNSHIIASGVGDLPRIFGSAELDTAQDAELPAPMSFQLANNWVHKWETKCTQMI